MVTAEFPISLAHTAPLRASESLPAPIFQEIRRQLVLDHCKWDPQVGDVSTLSPFPLLLGKLHWQALCDLAERLTAELMSAEQELLHRPELHRRLGLSRSIRSVLRRAGKLGATPAAARVLRFDFHWTPSGWRISEVNSDVPGGFCEGSELPALMAPHYPGAQAAGNPGAAWADAIVSSLSSNSVVALLAAAGFMEDQQITAYLARLLNRRGIVTYRTMPEHLRWEQGCACLPSCSRREAVGAIVRFYQAEWLNARRCSELFAGGKTPVANPGIAVLTETKRFPLVWDQLSTPMPTWHKLLPVTVDPRDADWRHDGSWLVKSALCNTGDTVLIRSLLTDRQWHRATRSIRFHPGAWVAQQKFITLPLESPAGTIYPCIGVYTVNGHAAGMYGRFSRGPVIDFAAVDAAVLIEDAGE